MGAGRAWDVAVVGGGSAGCAMAARLASGGSRSVVLMEAGPDLRGSPPALMHDGWRTYRDSDWGFESEPDRRGEVEPLFRGKVLGGSSWMTRFAVRGAPADFDGWMRMGNPGWGFADTLDAFRRLESDLDFGGESWHGDAGPIPVTRYPGIEQSPFESAVAGACAAAGIPVIDDHNQPGVVGAARMPRNGRDGVRVTSADGYLPAGATPPNLAIAPNAQVSLVRVEGNQAVGLRMADGTDVDAGWVVLCAGTYASPTILLRSGIGPADHLRRLGIEVRSALAGVGDNLADHQGFDVDVGYRGARGSPARFFWLATFRSTTAAGNEPPALGLWIPEPFSWADEAAESAVTAVLLTPRSRGTVRLRSADPAAPPSITLPGLSDPTDLELLAEASVRAEEVAEHPSLRRLCEEPPTVLPKDARQLRELLSQEAWSYPHTVGTCAMGPSPDGGAVVDASGDVHGIARLTIADASIIPTAPSGFPHLIVLMIAEHISELLAQRL